MTQGLERRCLCRIQDDIEELSFSSMLSMRYRMDRKVRTELEHLDIMRTIHTSKNVIYCHLLIRSSIDRRENDTGHLT